MGRCLIYVCCFFLSFLLCCIVFIEPSYLTANGARAATYRWFHFLNKHTHTRLCAQCSLVVQTQLCLCNTRSIRLAADVTEGEEGG